MDRKTLESLLADAERGISQGIMDLERLRVLAVNLDMAGVDSAPTRAIIAGCEAAQASQIADRDELLRALGAITQSL